MNQYLRWALNYAFKRTVSHFAPSALTCKAGPFHWAFDGFCGVIVDYYSEIRPF